MENSGVIKLFLTNIAQGGDAFGRHNGKPVFVEGGAPGETILCKVSEDHKTWMRCGLLEIIDPSPERTESVCALYKKCGGCNLQHIKYNAQLDIKVFILKESFIRIGAVDPPEIEIFPPPVLENSPPDALETPPCYQWEYRNRMQFHCVRQKTKNASFGADKPARVFGLKGKGNEIIAVNDCPVAAPGIRKALNSSSVIAPPEKDRFTIFSKDDVLLSEGGVSRGKIKLLNKEIILDARIFFQSNCFMLEKLIIELMKIAGEADQNLPAADLYCGAGTFAIFLADIFPKVILAEENKTAVSIAGENLRGKNAEFFALKDSHWPKVLFQDKSAMRTAGFAVVDPPRAGLSTSLALSLALNGPPVLSYVSCDAASLARDSKILINGGYHLTRLMMFDFYPQTAHIESLAVFKRNKSPDYKIKKS